MICPSCGAKNLPGAPSCVACEAVLDEYGESEVDPLIGTTVANKYTIDSIIGEGSMGCVYAAAQQGLDHEVALKILHPHVAADPKVLRRFHREARTTSRLTHPNTVQILDFGKDEDGTLYLAMELLDGPNLLEVINEDSPLTPKRIGSLLGQVLLALEEAHDHGIVHRDLKPENVMVVSDHQGRERVKVCDFGIAKLVEAEGSAITVTGFVCGTPEYMAPEQARGEGLDGRADLYALGCVLYRMLTGKPPFRAGSALGTITKHLTDELDPPRERAPERRIPASLERVCLRALAKDREDRFSDAAEMRTALEAAVDALGDLGGDRLGTLLRDPTDERSRSPLPWVVGATALCCAGALAWFAWSSGPTEGGTSPEVDGDLSSTRSARADAGADSISSDTSADTRPDAEQDAEREDAQQDARPEDTGLGDSAANPRADSPAVPPVPPSTAMTRPRVDSGTTSPEPASTFEEGRRRFLAHDVQGAIESFRTAARRSPRNAQIQKELGRAYMRAGDTERGTAAYRRYLELAPNAPDRALIERILGREPS